MSTCPSGNCNHQLLAFLKIISNTSFKMCSTNSKTPSAFNPGYRRPTAAVVGTIEAPRGHNIGPSHTAQMATLNNKMQMERTTHGAVEGHIKIQEKEKEYLCLKIQRLDRQLERARQEHDVQILKQYVEQQEMQVKHAEDRTSCSSVLA